MLQLCPLALEPAAAWLSCAEARARGAARPALVGRTRPRDPVRAQPSCAAVRPPWSRRQGLDTRAAQAIAVRAQALQPLMRRRRPRADAHTRAWQVA